MWVCESYSNALAGGHLSVKPPTILRKVEQINCTWLGWIIPYTLGVTHHCPAKEL